MTENLPPVDRNGHKIKGLKSKKPTVNLNWWVSQANGEQECYIRLAVPRDTIIH